jgi:hypothetical protein
MFFYSNHKDAHLKNVTDFVCFIKMLTSEEIIAVKPTEVLFTKAIVPIDLDKFGLDKLGIAIVSTIEHVDSKLLNYQLPNVIQIAEPRIKKVAQCFHHIYKFDDKVQIFLRAQKTFGIAQIIIHDATTDTLLADFVKSDADFVNLRQFDINPSSICKMHPYGRHHQDCLTLFETEMKRNRYLVEWISLNDCYISLGYIYEFVAVYDTDEVKCLQIKHYA